MKLFKRIISAAAVLCLLLALVPAACGEDGMDKLYKDKSWDEVIEEFFQRYNVNEDGIALGYYNTVTGEEHYFNADKYMVAGSMFKVPLNMCFAEKVYNGEMDWDTKIGSIRYDILLNETIVNSNNDYAKTLWMKLGNGTYRTYRQIIAPYMGEDPETVDPKYYENNFFTPRQMIYCLKLLYEQSERFPKVIETMQKAEPNEYFKRYEQRFDIAHKYGFLQEEYHLYMNDCAIAYTDDPIVFVMFTDNTNKAYEVMGEFSTLMCDYTQYNTALRREAELKEQQAHQTAPEEKTGTSQPAEMSPEKNTGSGKGPGFGTLLLGAAVVIAMFAALAAALRGKRKHGISLFWSVLAVIFAGGAMLLSIIGVNTGTIVARADGDPRQTVTEFMDSLAEGDYSEAYTKLYGYSSLGLENQPADPVGQMLYQALKESYSYELYGQCSVDKLEARQQVQLSYLDLTAIESDVQAETMEVLEGFVKSRPRNELYDDNNNYLPEVAQEAYSTAVASVLEHAEDYYTTAGVLLQLKYRDESWSIVPGRDLLKAISGGTY